MRLIWISLGLIALAAIAAGSTAANMHGQTDNKTSIVFVFDRDFAPFTYEEDGSIHGFELDLLRLVGEEEGFRPTPEPMTWTGAQQSFQRGDADVIGGTGQDRGEAEAVQLHRIPSWNL
jgi:ABC-type amino acid transport substrate-binding protein